MPICPSCAKEVSKRIGPIPSVNYFAGNSLDHTLDGGALYKCQCCGLSFRYPSLSKAQMDILYRKNTASVWQNEVGDRIDWQIAKRWIEACVAGGKVLDVGCFDGHFLGTLGGGFIKYGIEISADAATKAVQNGIQIIGDDFVALKENAQTFDVVLSIDVIEHVADPYEFLVSISSAVNPGGWIIISTGNIDSLAWRIAGSRYWYCSLAEHISFVSPQWCSNAAEKLNLEVIETDYFCHSTASLWDKTKAFLKAIYHRVRCDVGQIYGPANDHFIVLLRKKIEY